jgi:hypothetical protein
VQSAMLLIKLAVPIAYNFLTITGVKNTAFFRVMGPVTHVEFLGEAFTSGLFPAVLCFVCLLVVFRIDGMLYNFFGVKQYEFDTEHRQQEIMKGKAAIRCYKQKLQTETLNSPLKS